MFPKDYWYVLCESTELSGSLFARTILNMPLVAYRTPSGEAVVLEDFCPHRGLPLSLGKIESEGVRCGTTACWSAAMAAANPCRASRTSTACAA